MEYIVLSIILVAVILAVVMTVIKQRKSKVFYDNHTELSPLVKKRNIIPNDEQMQEFVIKLEVLLEERSLNENKLLEIKNSKILAYVNNLVPELAQIRNNAHNAAQAAKKNGEILYKIDIPMSALVESKEKAGAFRAFSREANHIQKNANLTPQKMQKGTEIVSNASSAAMGVASMIVGQYYMDQINSKLELIEDGISQISNFQNNEYRSKVFSLVAHIKKIADYQVEILENDELRIAKITQLDILEEKCTQLLGQANLTLSRYTEKNNLDYVSYEKELTEANKWYLYQKSLLEVLCRISDLRYTLHLGAASREYCTTLLPTYTRQVEETMQKIADWHHATTERLKIDTSGIRRKRGGLDGAIHFLPGLFNDKLNFRAIEESTAKMIKLQSAEHYDLHKQDTSELYTEDVQLIVKGEKIYYLPTDGKGSL